jgi:hypothetical protein
LPKLVSSTEHDDAVAVHAVKESTQPVGKADALVAAKTVADANKVKMELRKIFILMFSKKCRKDLLVT